MDSINIGQVHVCPKGTKNPYTAQEPDRIEAFKKLHLGISQDVEFWCCPAEGGAYILTDPKNQINGLEFWVNRDKR